MLDAVKIVHEIGTSFRFPEKECKDLSRVL